VRWGTVGSLAVLAALAVPTAEARVALGEACPGERALAGGGLAYGAYVNGRVVARQAPDGRALRSFGRLNRNGARTVFGALSVIVDGSCTPKAYRVQLPMRPNGASGVVPIRAVTLHPVRARIEIDLSTRRLLLFRDGEQVLSTTAGIGASGTPTPTGSYYVNQRLRPDEPAGPFGPGAIGISAFSPTLTDWAQGGPVAIHGTNDPTSVGRSISHGCIRVQNPVLRRLYRVALPGTPVVIHA
jgi:lipoprotein-anchoring transpeptidase ErfK/SrfK